MTDDELIAELERRMPRDWLTPDLRCQVAEVVIDALNKPWEIHFYVAAPDDGDHEVWGSGETGQTQ